MRNFYVAFHLVAITLLIAFLTGCSESETRSVSSAENIASSESIQGMEDPGAGLDSAIEEVAERTDQLFAFIETGEGKQIYESMCDPRFREAATLEQFQSLCERIQKRLGALKSKQSLHFNLSSSQGHPAASVVYQSQFAKGSGTVLVVLEKIDEQWLLLRLNVNAPELLDDPSQYRESVELLVQNSPPVLPGAMVNVVDESTDPPEVIAAKVKVLNVRWKVSSPLEAPKSPAEGFVSVALTKEQSQKVLEVESLSLREVTKQE